MDSPRCGGRRKPNIICFGENVPKTRVEQGYSMVGDAEASSLTVFSGHGSVRGPVPAGGIVRMGDAGASRVVQCGSERGEARGGDRGQSSDPIGVSEKESEADLSPDTKK